MTAITSSVTTSKGFTIGTRELTSHKTDKPLLVYIPGGSYNAAYFDVPGMSALEASAMAGFDAVALDRPNYGGSDKLSDAETTFARNAEIIDDAIAKLWERYGAAHPGVILIGHSMGGAIGVHIAAGQPTRWPLLGLSMSGVNELSPEHVVGAWSSMPQGQPVTFSDEQRRMFMYGPDGSFEPDAINRASLSAEDVPLAELVEIVGAWPRDILKLAPRVNAPVHYMLAEHDQLWVVSPEQVELFAGRFTAAPFVETNLMEGVGHNVDHHLAHDIWYRSQLAFAARCARHADSGKDSVLTVDA